MKYIFLSIVFLSVLCGCEPRRLYTDNRLLMGTFVEVTSRDKRAAAIVFDEIKRVEDLLSKYKPSSEVSRLNTAGSIRAGADLYRIVKISIGVTHETEGAFDITVAPLVDLWGFTTKRYALPAPEAVIRTLPLIGADKISLNPSENMIQFNVTGMKIDLGGIAKGYALDCAIQALRDHGIKDCLINLGGQVSAIGFKSAAPAINPFGLIRPQPWRVALKNPRTKGLDADIEIRDQSISTSGDYEQFFITGGKRYSHIIDPRTGYPADTGIIAVTVIAPDGTTADALSTAIFVLGKEHGEELAKKFPGARIIKIHST